MGCAVKGVYASLWNKRAIEERFFARIDQTNIAMGLAIVPAYDLESEIAANTVVVTRVLNTDDVFGYSLSVQQGNNLVTNPDPGTYSEVTIAAFIGDDEPTSLTVTRFAKPTPDAAGAHRAGAVHGSGCWSWSTWPRRWRRRTAGPSRATTRDCRFVTVGERQGGRPRPGGQDPGERAPGLQAGPRVRRPLIQTFGTSTTCQVVDVPKLAGAGSSRPCSTSQETIWAPRPGGSDRSHRSRAERREGAASTVSISGPTGRPARKPTGRSSCGVHRARRRSIRSPTRQAVARSSAGARRRTGRVSSSSRPIRGAARYGPIHAGAAPPPEHRSAYAACSA